MKKNLRSALATVIVLLGCIGYVVYGYGTSWGAVPATVGLVAGTALAALDWITRYPGRRPNPKALLAARAIGVGLYPLIALVGKGPRLSDQLGVFAAGLLVPLVGMIAIRTPIVARQRPGYWQR